MTFSQYTVFKQTLVVFTGQPNIEEELLLFIICLFVEFMRFNSYAAKLKKKLKLHINLGRSEKKIIYVTPKKATQANHTNHAQKYNI